jgi:hypothetical protein
MALSPWRAAGHSRRFGNRQGKVSAHGIRRRETSSRCGAVRCGNVQLQEAAAWSLRLETAEHQKNPTNGVVMTHILFRIPAVKLFRFRKVSGCV